MADNLKRKEEFFPEQEVKQEPTYTTFIASDRNQAKVQELVFFASLALFCISTAILSLLFLTIGLSAFISFSLAMLISLVTGVVSKFVYTYIKQEDF